MLIQKIGATLLLCGFGLVTLAGTVKHSVKPPHRLRELAGMFVNQIIFTARQPAFNQLNTIYNNWLQVTFFPLRLRLRSKNSLRSALRAAPEPKR